MIHIGSDFVLGKPERFWIMFDDGGQLEIQANSTNMSVNSGGIDIGLSGDVKLIYTQGGAGDLGVCIGSLDGLL